MQTDDRHVTDIGSESHVGRYRRVGAATLGVLIALALVGGIFLSRRVPDQATTQLAATTTAPPAVPAIEWNTAMVARDDTTITVYASPGDRPCKELAQPQATITEQTDTSVVIAVSGRIVDLSDCTATTGLRVPLVVSLQQPLGSRVLRDAASALPPPTFSERDLPDLTSDKRWSPHSTHCDEGWCQGYNGPNGSVLHVAGDRRVGGERPSAVGTVSIGSRNGTITGSAATTWAVRWEVEDVTYTLRLSPTEGETFSLRQFRAELARLTWH
ncbi:hypothetical protein ACQEUX_31070 [Micromonospora sp. CA-259024]|uniref:hypothetical protein n=1 Tax=Micromonospora sp. CA-259024 TaxID=3239965 RepID=UPI003D8EB208